MRKFLLIAAVLALTVSSAQAGPFGLFGGCKCGQSSGVGPVRKLIQHVKDKRPVATATANTLHAAGAFVESRPVAMAVRSVVGVSSCPNGQCPLK